MPGYPDWQRVDTRVQAALFYAAAQPVTAQVVLGPWPVANLERVLFRVELNGSGTYQIIVGWFNDFALTQQVGQLDVVVDSIALSWTQSLAIQAGYLHVFIDPLIPFAGDKAKVSIVPDANPVAITENTGLLIDTFGNQSIAAATTTSFESIVVVSGPAVLHAFSTATSWTIEVQFKDLGGVWNAAYHWEFTTANQTVDQLVVLPPAPTQLVIHNRDAAAKSFTFTLAPTSY